MVFFKLLSLMMNHVTCKLHLINFAQLKKKVDGYKL